MKAGRGYRAQPGAEPRNQVITLLIVDAVPQLDHTGRVSMAAGSTNPGACSASPRRREAAILRTDVWELFLCYLVADRRTGQSG
jgi:hypothetical protein